jgi:ubiquinone/menaquinone biosynthesis C-methylase UbiE
VNLGGEGEGQGIELNLLDPDMLRRPLASIKRDAAGRLVQGDMLHMPFAENSMDGVVGNKVPAVPTLVNGMPAEAFRVLKPGGTIKVMSQSGGARTWLQPLKDAGFTDVTEQGGYAVGVKPVSEPGANP